MGYINGEWHQPDASEQLMRWSMVPLTLLALLAIAWRWALPANTLPQTIDGATRSQSTSTPGVRRDTSPVAKVPDGINNPVVPVGRR